VESETREWYELRQKGWTLAQIAEKHGMTKQAVQQRLKRHGFPGKRS
jgi:transcriptional regulator with XRE-family HTH domain